MNTWTLIGLLALAIWWHKPLRNFLIQRTNRTVKVLLVVFPLLFVTRLAYRVYYGEQDGADVVTLTVLGLLLLWIFLVWLGNFLERRRPTQAQAPNLAALARLPGVPRVPAAVTSPEAQRAARAAAQVLTSPEAQRAARAAVQAVTSPEAQRTARAAAQAASKAASQVDWQDVAGSLGRTSGRWVGRLKRNLASGSDSGSK